MLKHLVTHEVHSFLLRRKEVLRLTELKNIYFDKDTDKDGFVWVANIEKTTNDKLSGFTWIQAWKEYMNKHGRKISDITALECSEIECDTHLEEDERAGAHVFVLSQQSEMYLHICIVPTCKKHNDDDYLKPYQVKESDLVDRFELEKFIEQK